MRSDTYQVKLTYVTAKGESSLSGSQTVTTSGNSTSDNASTITISSPPPLPPAIGATGWYAYVAQAGTTSYRRQTGAPTPIRGT